MGAAKTLRSRLEREPLWWLGIGVIIGVVGAGLGALLASKSEGAWSALGSAVASAGVGIIAVGVVGGALAFAWRAIERQRDAEAFARDKIRVEFADLVVLYNGVKSVRRTLRALGLDAKLLLDPEKVKENEKGDKRYYDPNGGQGIKEMEAAAQAVELTREQAAGFQEQMGRLNEFQLRYEAKKRQFQQADLLGKDQTAAAKKLKAIESWLNKLVSLWEEHGWEIREGTLLVEISPRIQPLLRKLSFRQNFSEPMEDLTDVFNAHLFGEPAGANLS